MRIDPDDACKPTNKDIQAAAAFFEEFPHLTSWCTGALAILSWHVAEELKKPSGYDKYFQVRRCRSLRGFLGAFQSGELLSQIGQAGYEFNGWVQIRYWFTEAEASRFFHTNERMPVVGLDDELIWESDPKAIAHYRSRGQAVPREVEAKARLRALKAEAAADETNAE